MTVIVFLIDTSASMMQKQYLGTTLLDFARLTVEQFLKQRQRDPASTGDRYMLMTFEEYPFNIKSGWKESQRVFNEQLKGLRAKGVANFEQSVESVMRLLTVNRMQTGAGAGIENYGFGRFPSYAEHVVIVPVVDGSELPAADPAAQVPKPRLLVGNDFTAEAFRWDQRMFPIVLRLGGHQRTQPIAAGATPASGTVTVVAAAVTVSTNQQQQQTVPLPDRSIAETYATQMGGRSFAITSHRMLFQCIDTIMQRIQSNGVLVRFRQQHGVADPSASSTPPVAAAAVPSAVDDAFQQQQHKQKEEAATKDFTTENALSTSSPPTTAFASGGAIGAAMAAVDQSWTDSLVLVKAKPNTGPSFWPIPEQFWPDTVRNSLPARPAHPVVLFRCERAEPMFNPEFPLDKYELDSTSSLVQQMLSRREPNLCWQVFVEGSFKQPGIGLPFGYLKVSSSSTVNLLVMPYNYPDLLTLLAQAKEGPKMVASVPFQQRFDKYLSTVPPYYYTYLKKQLSRLKIAPPSLEEANTKLYGYINLGTHHTKMKQQGIQELEFATMAVQKCLSESSNANVFGTNPASFIKLSRVRAMIGKSVPMTADCVPSLRPALGLLPSMQHQQPHQQQQQQSPQMVPGNGGPAELTIFVPSASACPSSAWSSPAASVAVPPSQLFKNPFDIPRSNLCIQLDKMRINFEQQVRSGGGAGGSGANVHVFQGGPPGQKIKLQHVEDLACLPISKMGIYEDYVKSLIAIGLGPKRELEPQAARPHAFGNPFKLDKKSNLYIADEVGEMSAGVEGTSLSTDMPSSSSSNGGAAAATTSSGGSGRRRRAASEAGTTSTSGVRPPRRRPGPIDPARLDMWRRRRCSGTPTLTDGTGGAQPLDSKLRTSTNFEQQQMRLTTGTVDGSAEPGQKSKPPQHVVAEGLPCRLVELGNNNNDDDEEEEEDIPTMRELLVEPQRQAAVARPHAFVEEEEEEEMCAEVNDGTPAPLSFPTAMPSSFSSFDGDGTTTNEEPTNGDSVDRRRRAASEAGTTATAGIRPPRPESGSLIDDDAQPAHMDHRRCFDAPTATDGAGSSSSSTQQQLLDKMREIRQIVRLKGPSNVHLAQRVASVAATCGGGGGASSRKRARELFELAIGEARRFKRTKLCELIGLASISALSSSLELRSSLCSFSE